MKFYHVRFIFIIALVILSQLASAQKSLYFFNSQKNKLIEVHEGHYLSLQYTGYLGQTEFVKNVVTAITDSTITLGVEMEKFGFLGTSNSRLVPPHKIIRIKDITAFRKMTVARQLVKSACTIGAVLGSYFLLYDLYNSPSVSRGGAFFISIGVGVGSSLLFNALFPENVKYRLPDGWQVVVAENKPVFIKQ